MISSKKAISILIVIIGASYANSLLNSFVYDDVHFIVGNDYIKDLSQWRAYFTSPYAVSSSTHSIWRPLRTLSYAFDYALWGLRPFWFHVTNVFMHMANAVLVFYVGRRFFDARNEGVVKTALSPVASAFIAALLWAVHPVQTETVSWVASRGDILYIFFGLSALLCYTTRVRRRMMYGLSILFFVLALLAKETACVFIGILFLWESFFRYNKPFARAACVRIIPFGVVAGFFMLARFFVLGSLAQRSYWGGSFFATMLTTVSLIPQILKLTVFPQGLHVIYRPELMTSIMRPTVLAGLALVSGTAAALYSNLRARRWYWVLALSWGIIFLAPTSNIIPLKGLFSEHFLYGALIGAAWVSVMALDAFMRLVQAGGVAPHTTLLMATYGMVLVVGLYCIGTVERNVVWRNDHILWAWELEQGFESAEAHCGLGIVLGKQGKFDKAIGHFKRALAINPHYDAAHYSLAVSYMGREAPDRARARFHAMQAEKLGFMLHPGFVAMLNETEHKDNYVASSKLEALNSEQIQNSRSE